MNPSTEKGGKSKENTEDTALYMIGLDADHPWEGSAQEEIRVSEDVPEEVRSRIQRFALRMLKKKGVSSSVREAIRQDATASLLLRRISPEEYDIEVKYRDTEHAAAATEEEEEEEEEKGEIWDAAEYLKYITFTKDDEAIKTRLMELVGASLTRMEKGMMEALEPLRKVRIEEKQCPESMKKEWLTCDGECSTAAKRDIQRESESTAYFFRCLAHSVFSLQGEGKQKIELDLKEGEPSDLTGQWKEDIRRFGLVSYGPSTMGGRKGRLVMGFGPSASGKTFLTRMLLNLLRQADPDLPDIFITVDGDKYRENSYTYKKVTEVADKICAEGFANLMTAGWKSKITGSLFNSSDIKSASRMFLEAQRIPIHLYVPHTLSACTPLGCEGEYRPYQKITGDDRWIGMMIWQHEKGGDCTFPVGYQCNGCTESGEARQKENGKKYSSDGWEGSMKYGKQEVRKAPGGAYLIHNSGGKSGSRSVILDVSKEITPEKREIFVKESEKEESTWVYYVETEVKKEIEGVHTLLEETETTLKEMTNIQKRANHLADLRQRMNDTKFLLYGALYPEEMAAVHKKIDGWMTAYSTAPAAPSSAPVAPVQSKST